MSEPTRINFEESNTFFKHIFKSIGEGLIISDSSGTITFVNTRTQELFGYTEQELVGQKVEILIPRKHHHNHKQVRGGYMEKPSRKNMGSGRHMEALHKNGNTFYSEVSLNRIEADGTNYVVALVTDITKRVEAEQKITQLNVELEAKVLARTKELEDALKKEKELNEMKSRFVSMASHEFRTPLGTILSSNALIKNYINRNDFDKTEKHLRRIENNVKGLTDILNDFLSTDKLESNLVVIKKQSFSYKKFIEEVKEDLQTFCQEGQVILSEIEASVPQVIFSDRNVLKNILFNLLTNAIKYSKEFDKVYLNSSMNKGNLEVSIIDSGIGIPKNDQSKLFTRFYRANNATNIKGTGLGLVIVRSYLNLLNGDISYKSAENEGSCFTIKIPIE